MKAVDQSVALHGFSLYTDLTAVINILPERDRVGFRDFDTVDTGIQSRLTTHCIS